MKRAIKYMKRAIKYIMRQNASNCLLGTPFFFLGGGEGARRILKDHMVFRKNGGISVVTDRVLRGLQKIDCLWVG